MGTVYQRKPFQWFQVLVTFVGAIKFVLKRPSCKTVRLETRVVYCGHVDAD